MGRERLVGWSLSLIDLRVLWCDVYIFSDVLNRKLWVKIALGLGLALHEEKRMQEGLRNRDCLLRVLAG